MRFVWWGAFAGAAVWSFVALMSYLVFDTIGTGMVSYGSVPGFTPEPFSFAWIAPCCCSLSPSSNVKILSPSAVLLCTCN